MSRNYLYSQEARFSEVEEIKSNTTRVVLTEKNEVGGLPVFVCSNCREMYIDGSDTNSLVCSDPGSGKSRRIAWQTCLSDATASTSMIIHDPKGELCRGLYPFLVERGYNVRIWNMRTPTGDQYNPLWHGCKLFKDGHEDMAVESWMDVAEALYKNQVDKNDKFWETQSSNYFLSLCLVGASVVEKPEELTIELIYRLHNEGIQKLGGSTFLKEYVNEHGTALMKEALLGILDAPTDTRQSIFSCFTSVISRLVINKGVSETISGRAITADEFIEKPTAFFLVTRDESTVYNALTACVIKQIYVRLLEAAERTSGVLGRRVDFIIDEFSTLPCIQDFNAMIAACRSRNIRFFIFVQSLFQLDLNYGHELASTILSACQNWILFHVSDPELNELFSKRAGTYISQFTGHPKPLIAPSQLQHFSKEKGEALLLLGRCYPYLMSLPDKSEFEKSLGIEEIAEIPPAKEERYKPKQFSIKDIVTKERDKKIEELLNSGANKEKKGESHINADPKHEGHIIDMINGTPGGINVDDLVARIDAKIAELEEEERLENEKQEEQKNKEQISDNKDEKDEDKVDSDSDSSSGEPIPLS